MNIQLEGVSKSYLLTRALDAISLSLSPSQIIAIVGTNGAGKTTLLRLPRRLDRAYARSRDL